MKKFLLASAAFLLVGAAHVSTAVSSPDCPPAQRYSGGCVQVIVWAKNPETGTCCQYKDPCSAPDGWTIYYSQSECEGGSTTL